MNAKRLTPDDIYDMYANQANPGDLVYKCNTQQIAESLIAINPDLDQDTALEYARSIRSTAANILKNRRR